MQPSDVIALAAVAVAGLGVGATVFTQMYQGKREGQRLDAARSEKDADWTRAQRINAYGEFLAHFRRWHTLIHSRFWAKRGDTDGEGEQLEWDDKNFQRGHELMGRLVLVAPEKVRSVAKRAAEEMTTLFRWAVQGNSEEFLQSWQATEAHLRLCEAAMRADLGIEPLPTATDFIRKQHQTGGRSQGEASPEA